MSNDRINWDAIYETPKFKDVYNRRLSFVIPSIVVFFILFTTLFTIQNYLPGIANYQVSGYINFAFAFTMILFPVFWVWGMLFCSYTAKNVHPLEEEIVEEYKIKEKLQA